MQSIFIVLMLSLAHSASSIKCDFSFIETDYNFLIDGPSNNSLKRSVRQPTVFVPKVLGAFECDEGFDPLSITTRFGPVDDQYESAESSCQAESKKITPKYLKNTRNENMALSQTSGRIQQLSIEQCVFASGNTKWEECTFEDQMKIPSHQKYICHNVYVRVTLYVESSKNADEFYYPSNCICELVVFKNSTST